MSCENNERPYLVPRYRAPGDQAFYHVLHGTVPGHQIDFLYCPEVPQGALSQTHFAHLTRLVQYIEPRAGAEHAFAIGNLSRDDVQHEPGHGGIALLFALRVPGVTDHAGRDMPPYAHGLLAVDRTLDYVTLLESATVFYRRFLEKEGHGKRRGDFYREYVRLMEHEPERVEPFLASSIAALDDLPHPGKSTLGWDFEATETASPRRIVIVHDDDEAFATLAHRASALGAMLYRSNIKWTSISTGRHLDIAGGTTIRFVPESEASSDEGASVYHIDDLPDDETALAERLFAARRRTPFKPAKKKSWRDGDADEKKSWRDGDADEPARKAPTAAQQAPSATPPERRSRPNAERAEARRKTASHALRPETTRRRPSRLGPCIGICLILGSLVGAVFLAKSMGDAPVPPPQCNDPETACAPTSQVTEAPASTLSAGPTTGLPSASPPQSSREPSSQQRSSRPPPATPTAATGVRSTPLAGGKRQF